MGFAGYYKKMLKDSERTVYDTIYQNMLNYQDTIRISVVDLETFSRIIRSVKYDNPELFYVNFNNMNLRLSSSYCDVLVSYTIPQQQLTEIQNKISKRTTGIIAIVKNHTPINKALILHDWLVHNSIYSTQDHYPNSAHTMIGAILFGECVCEGYSMAYKYLMDIVKIHCMVVCGEGIHPDGTKGNHAWNLVILNHKPYHVDVTFDQLFAGKYCSRAYFLLSTKQILYNHHIDNTIPIPKCEESGSILKLVTRTRELMDFLNEEAQKTVSHSEVRLSARFSKKQLFEMIEDWLNNHKEMQLARTPSYWFSDYNRTLFITWR